MRTTCSDCNNDREPDSPSYSYCKECNKKRQRVAYRNRMAAAGKTVAVRIEDGQSPDHVTADQGKPGVCEGCQEHSDTENLVVVFKYPIPANPDAPDDFDSIPLPYMLVCPGCRTLLLTIPAGPLWSKVTKLAATLNRRKLTRQDLAVG